MANDEPYGLIEPSNEQLRQSRDKFRTSTIILTIVTTLLLVLTILFAIYTYKYYVDNYSYVSLYNGPQCAPKTRLVGLDALSKDDIQSIGGEIQAYLDDTLSHTGAAAFYVSVVYNKFNGTNYFYSQGAGSINPLAKNITSPSNTTIFESLDVSSLLPVIALLQQEELGSLNLDDPISKFIQLNSTNSFDVSGITLRMLASHSSGLPLAPPCDLTTNCSVTTSQILANLAQQPGGFLVGSPYHPSYSVLGVNLLAHIIANVTGVSFESYASDNIFKKLNMTWTSFVNNYNLNNVTVIATPVKPTADPKNPFAEVDINDLGWARYGAQLFTNGEDISKLMASLLPGSNVSALSESSKQKMFGPSSFVDNSGVSFFAMPFASVLRHTVWSHNVAGRRTGASASLVIIPDMQLGIVAFVNQDVDSTLFSQGVADIIVPAFQKLFSQKPYYIGLPQPSDASPFLGTFKAADEYNNTITLKVESKKDGLQGTRTDNNGNSIQFLFAYEQANLLRVVPNVDDSCLSTQLRALKGQAAIFTNNTVSFPGLSYTQIFVKS